jgi:urease accessory protein
VRAPPRPGVRAAAAVEAERDPATGGTRCPVLRSAPPLTLRRTGGDRVHLVGSTAGPVGGDDLALTVRVGPAATLTLASIAASLVHPGPAGRRSTFTVDAEVGAGGALAWQTEPTVLVRGCDHEASVRVRLAAGARLAWREVVVLGRHHEPSGSLLQRLRVDRDGRPLVRNDLAIGPAWDASDGPAGIGDARAVATALVVAPGAADLTVPQADGARATVLPLADDAALVTVLAGAAGTAIACLDAAIPAVGVGLDVQATTA